MSPADSRPDSSTRTRSGPVMLRAIRKAQAAPRRAAAKAVASCTSEAPSIKPLVSATVAA
ncbi:hypothetical protein [Bradyrhizobium sp. STM 3809]|uniref:hypothetical protein n=1 Tax=Bradyrhizobium sp. STM 3809 TaxID=551936 RepID=UPI001F0AF836|nr:hypothetical protein [Bradyrhizobium sp. STM 3809]